MKDNRVRKSTISSIKYPTVWISGKNKVEQTSFFYRIKSSILTQKDYGNSGGLPESLFFESKKELLKSL
jgi:hypothetical protein